MSDVNLTINEMPVTAAQGTTILDAASAAGIRIPTLCFMKGLESHASCRICLVAAEGSRAFLPACATRVSEGMVIHTDTPEVRASRKNTLELLLARHSVDCHHCMRIGISRSKDLDPGFCEMCFFCDCVRDGICELQALAREYEVDALPYTLEPDNYHVDTSTGAVVRNPNKCIKCRRCVDVCRDVQSVDALSVVRRGPDIQVMPSQGRPLNETPCVSCGRCAQVCPTGAVHILEHKDELLYHTHDYDTTTIAQVSEDILDEMASLSGIKRWALDIRVIVAGLKKIGVDYVVTENSALSQGQAAAAAYLEANANNGNTPLVITSSQAAAGFVNRYFPSLAGDLFRYESAQQQFSRTIRENRLRELAPESYKKICTISVTANNENEGEAVSNSSVDYVLNARELYRIFLRTGVNLARINKVEQGRIGRPAELEPEMEQLLAPPVWEIGSPIDEMEIKIGSVTVKAAVGKTLSHARQLLEQVADGTSPYNIIKISS